MSAFFDGFSDELVKLGFDFDKLKEDIGNKASGAAKALGEGAATVEGAYTRRKAEAQADAAMAALKKIVNNPNVQGGASGAALGGVSGAVLDKLLKKKGLGLLGAAAGGVLGGAKGFKVADA